MDDPTNLGPVLVTPELAAEHGLTGPEYERVLAALGREPNLTELGIFSVMCDGGQRPGKGTRGNRRTDECGK